MTTFPPTKLQLVIVFDRPLAADQVGEATRVFQEQLQQELTTGADGGPWGYGAARVASVEVAS